MEPKIYVALMRMEMAAPGNYAYTAVGFPDGMEDSTIWAWESMGHKIVTMPKSKAEEMLKQIATGFQGQIKIANLFEKADA